MRHFPQYSYLQSATKMPPPNIPCCLHSEIFPYVQVVDMPRGSLVQGGSIGNPTLTWSTEGTAVTPFDATALVGQLNTTIYPVEVYVQVGRDWLADTPVDAGSLIVENIGQRFLSEFDRVIVMGDGATQPQGVLNATGTGRSSRTYRVR